MIKRRSDLDRRFIVLSFVKMTANQKKGWIVIAKGKYHYWLTEDISDTLKNNKDIIDRKVENALLENALGSKQVETIEEAIKDPDTGKVELKVVKKTEKHYPGNVLAQFFWLKNRKPETWRDKPDVTNDETLRKLDEILEGITDAAKS